MSNRQRRILEVLLNRQDEITAGQIAEEIQISTRTVHRELQELEPLLAANALSLVKKSGIGIQVGGTDENVTRFKEALSQSETVTYSPEERKVLIMCRLLDEVEPIKLFTLAHEMQAAIPTVSHDLDEIEPQLRKYGLTLVRRRGYGVEIEGSEQAKRELIGALAREYLDHSDLFGASAESSSRWPVTRRLLDMVGLCNFFAIEKTLWQLEEQWPNRLSETAYTHLLIRLSVAVTRIQRQHWIQASRQGEDAPDDDDLRLKRLAEQLVLTWPKDEQAYLLKLLDGEEAAAPDASSVFLEKYGLKLAENALDLIRSVEDRMNVPFAKDRSLLEGLIRHLGPALARLRNGEVIRNPLLSQIKKDYETLFAAVRKAMEETLPEVKVPDEEIGYIVMHFGASSERLNLFPRNIRALLVCTSGIGSSKLLAVRINKEIPQIELIGHYSWYEAARIPEDRYDLIISTVDLQLEPDRYIKLSPLLTREETERLKSYIRDITLHKPPAETSSVPDDGGPWERLRRMNSYSTEIIRLLDHFHVYEPEAVYDHRDLKSVLSIMLSTISDEGILQQKHIIVERLLQREQQGSQIIPDTELALFHTRSEWVRKPFLSLFRLNTPVALGGNEGASQVRQILLMLAPNELGKQSLEILSEVSAMLLLPEMIRLLEREDAETIKAFISREFEKYIKSKLEWREPS